MKLCASRFTGGLLNSTIRFWQEATRALDVVLEYWTKREMDTGGAADDRRDRFFVIHAHTCSFYWCIKRDSYVVQEWQWLALNTLSTARQWDVLQCVSLVGSCLLIEASGWPIYYNISNKSTLLLLTLLTVKRWSVQSSRDARVPNEMSRTSHMKYWFCEVHRNCLLFSDYFSIRDFHSTLS